ncbi:hypothetical protein MA9V1_238 [Chryseobacterium phage MA9V-1]|nr:hypothetical protein MA9V1_238 [Chryseobacterium phage MA9V-1]
MTHIQNDTVKLELGQIIHEQLGQYELKSQDYGPSWRAFRPLSLVDQMYNKTKRLRTLQQPGYVAKVNESQRDCFQALYNYAIFAMINQKLDIVDDVTNENTGTLLQEYITSQTIAEQIMQSKNADYGAAWLDLSVPTITDLIHVKLLRARQILANDGNVVASEGLMGTYVDIVNYATFALYHINIAEYGSKSFALSTEQMSNILPNRTIFAGPDFRTNTPQNLWQQAYGWNNTNQPFIPFGTTTSDLNQNVISDQKAVGVSNAAFMQHNNKLVNRPDFMLTYADLSKPLTDEELAIVSAEFKQPIANLIDVEKSPEQVAKDLQKWYNATAATELSGPKLTSADFQVSEKDQLAMHAGILKEVQGNASNSAEVFSSILDSSEERQHSNMIYWSNHLVASRGFTALAGTDANGNKTFSKEVTTYIPGSEKQVNISSRIKFVFNPKLMDGGTLTIIVSKHGGQHSTHSFEGIKRVKDFDKHISDIFEFNK